MGKSRTQTTTQGLDPRSQQYVNAMRSQAQQGAAAITNGGPLTTGEITADNIQAAMNPYIGNVVDATRGEFDHLRAAAMTDVNQNATAAGAFGGSRHGIAAGARLGELDRAQTSQIAGLLSQGYGQALSFAEHQRSLREAQLQEPLMRYQNSLQLMNLGMGPTGTTSTQTTPGNLLGDLAGIAMVGGGLLMGGPAGASAGAQAAGALRGPPPSYLPPSWQRDPFAGSLFGRG